MTNIQDHLKIVDASESFVLRSALADSQLRFPPSFLHLGLQLPDYFQQLKFLVQTLIVLRLSIKGLHRAATYCFREKLNLVFEFTIFIDSYCTI